MTRHEPLSAQAATPPSRPAGDLTPVDGRTIMTPLLDQNWSSKFRIIGPFIAPSVPTALPPEPGPCRPRAGQIQKHP